MSDLLQQGETMTEMKADVTQADIDLANDVAGAIASVGVAYSHDTDCDMRTVNRRWFVHNSCEGNPFDKNEWIETFTDKTTANEFARNLRQERASQAAARHRIAHARPADDVVEAAKAVIADRDARCADREQFKEGGAYGDYWSPDSTMVSSSVIAGLRAALAKAGQ